MYLFFFFKALVFVHCYITEQPNFFFFFCFSPFPPQQNNIYITYPYINITI